MKMPTKYSTGLQYILKNFKTVYIFVGRYIYNIVYIYDIIKKIELKTRQLPGDILKILTAGCCRRVTTGIGGIKMELWHTILT
jgi:hypothetical protein